MHPSMQVVHIPLNGLTESSVRFLVSVAAEALRRVYVIGILLVFSCANFDWNVRTNRPRQLARMARFQKAHGVVVALEADRREIQTSAAQRGGGGRSLAPQLADGADVNAGAALATLVAGDIEGPGNLAMVAASRKSDGAGHHLLLADADAQAALDAVFLVRLVAHLAHAVLAGQVLDALRLRASSDVQLEQ